MCLRERARRRRLVSACWRDEYGLGGVDGGGEEMELRLELQVEASLWRYFQYIGRL